MAKTSATKTRKRKPASRCFTRVRRDRKVNISRTAAGPGPQRIAKSPLTTSRAVQKDRAARIVQVVEQLTKAGVLVDVSANRQRNRANQSSLSSTLPWTSTNTTNPVEGEKHDADKPLRISVEVPITPPRELYATIHDGCSTPDAPLRRRSARLIGAWKDQDNEEYIRIRHVSPTPEPRPSKPAKSVHDRAVRFADVVRVQLFDHNMQSKMTTKTDYLPEVCSKISDRLSYLRDDSVFRPNIHFRVFGSRLSKSNTELCASDIDSLEELLERVEASSDTAAAPYQVQFRLHDDSFPDGYDQSEDSQRWRVDSKRSEEAFEAFVQRCRTAVWVRYKKWRTSHGEDFIDTRGRSKVSQRQLDNACQVIGLVEFFWKR